jgi:hypothetical protein
VPALSLNSRVTPEAMDFGSDGSGVQVLPPIVHCRALVSQLRGAAVVQSAVPTADSVPSLQRKAALPVVGPDRSTKVVVAPEATRVGWPALGVQTLLPTVHDEGASQSRGGSPHSEGMTRQLNSPSVPTNSSMPPLIGPCT